jgi:NADH dehydrogenase
MSKWWKVVAAVAGGFAYSLWDGHKISARKYNSRLARNQRFVVLGGGFAGTEAARQLAKLIPDGCEIILIDQHDYLLFTPMLTEAVGAQVSPHHIAVPLRTWSSRIKVITAKVKEINLSTRSVILDGDKVIAADHLVIALGASSNFHGIPGVEGASFELKTLDDADGIRKNALAMVKEAADEQDPVQRSAKLTFVVAGGGYTGVEGIAALNELVRAEAANCPSLAGVPVRTVLIEPLKRLMSEVTPDLAAYSQEQLEKAGVEVKLQVGLKSVNGDLVELSNGEQIRTKTLIWTAGVRANPLVSDLGVPTGKAEAIKVNECFAVEGEPNVWAVGDCAEIPVPGKKGTYAPTAQNATREGSLVAQNIVRALRGEELKPFRYTPIGELALVGRRKGVARVYGMNFSGFAAYAMWRAIYIMKMPSVAQRLRVLSDWFLDTTLGSVAP